MEDNYLKEVITLNGGWNSIKTVSFIRKTQIGLP
jgi:hypothetical protein